MRRQDAISVRAKCWVAAAVVCVCTVVTFARAHAEAAGKAAPAVIPLSATGPGSLNGIWGNPGPAGGELTVTTADGKPIPYQPAIATLLARRKTNASAKSVENDQPESACVPAGMPRMMDPPVGMPLEIQETPRGKDMPAQVTVLFGSFGIFRIIRLNQKQAADPDPAYFGNSVGHWEGNTLVVDTNGLVDKSTLFGAPRSEKMHLVERISHVDKDTLQDRITIDDPMTYTRPWTWVITLKRQPTVRLQEEERHPC
jgi:hypothetical protein